MSKSIQAHLTPLTDNPFRTRVVVAGFSYHPLVFIAFSVHEPTAQIVHAVRLPAPAAMSTCLRTLHMEKSCRLDALNVLNWARPSQCTMSFPPTVPVTRRCTASSSADSHRGRALWSEVWGCLHRHWPPFSRSVFSSGCTSYTEHPGCGSLGHI